MVHENDRGPASVSFELLSPPKGAGAALKGITIKIFNRLENRWQVEYDWIGQFPALPPHLQDGFLRRTDDFVKPSETQLLGAALLARLQDLAQSQKLAGRRPKSKNGKLAAHMDPDEFDDIARFIRQWLGVTGRRQSTAR